MPRSLRTFPLACLLAALAGAPASVVAIPHGGTNPTFSVMMPMRDGVQLAADVYLPDAPGPVPVILTRTPYNRQEDSVDPLWIDDVLFHGYAYVVQDTRGRFASQGADSTFWTDGWGALRDGYDTIEWIAGQGWCDGNVGMHGWSARGIVQYRAAGAAPPHLKACMATIACEDFYQKAFFEGGELLYNLVHEWFESQEAEELLPFFLAHPKRDAFWDQLDLGTRAAEVEVPILHVGGLFDIFSESAIDAYRMLDVEGGGLALGNQRLVLGPWTHEAMTSRFQGELTFPENAYYDLRALTWRWYDRWLKGVQNGVDEEPPVEIYLMGDVDHPERLGNEWVAYDSYPPPAVETSFYLNTAPGSNGVTLIPTPPTSASASVTWTANPVTPVATRGGRNLFIPAGPYDQRPVHQGRSDVLRFTTAKLDEPVVITGKVLVELFATSTALDADFCAKLIDVYPDGREILITDGILRARFRHGFDHDELIQPGVLDRYEIDLWSTSYAFDVNHKIMLALAGSNWPRFATNPQTGAAFGGGGIPVSADLTVHADATWPSRIILPVTNDVLLAVGSPGVPLPPPRTRLRAVPRRNPAPAFIVRVSGLAPGSQPLEAGIYSVGGALVRRLDPASGAGEVLGWDGTNEHHERAPSGAYLLRLLGASGEVATTRLVLLR